MGHDRAIVSAGWHELFDQMSQLQAEVEVLSDGRPLDRAEGTRYLARLLAAGLSRFDGRPGPAIDYATPRIGGFNPDYRFGHARIDRGGTYRLRGRMNDVGRLALSTYAGALASGPPIGHLSSRRIRCDADGTFELVISDEAPGGSDRNWLPKSSKAGTMMVRQLLLHPSDQPAELGLERVDAFEPSAPDPLTVERGHDRMAGAALFVAGAAGRFFRWTQLISRLSNTIRQVPVEIEAEVRADPDTFYAIGYFDLAEGERLEVRITPPQCDYWGLHTTNHWLEPIEHDSITCYRNQATSEANADGSFTLSISPADDTHPNSLPTLGHRNGAIFFRVVGADGPDVALPVCTVRGAGR
jgi:uncharacterized protein DUF1214